MFDTREERNAPSRDEGRELPEATRRELVAGADEAIGEAQSHINAATARQLSQLADFDRLGGWNDQGAKTCEEWLSWRCGIAPAEARNYVLVARRLRELPRVRAAFGRGELSYWQVRAMAPIATPEIEEALLTIARASTAGQLQSLARAYKGALDAAELRRSNERHAQRSLHHFYDDDGFLVLRGKLTPEDGAVLLSALDAAEKALLADMTAGDRRDTPFEAIRADALVESARRALAAPEDATPALPEIQLIVGIDSLKAGAGDTCEVLDGPALASETARRLSCDAIVQGLLRDDGNITNVGRRRRTISPRMRRVLERRDQTCRFPGCNRRRFRDGHHIEHWIDDGETKTSNITLLCKFHHRLVHEGGFRVEGDADAGTLRFLRPDGSEIEAVPKRPEGDLDVLVARHRQRQLTIDDRTCTTGWTGESLDLDAGLYSLLSESGMLELPARAP